MLKLEKPIKLDAEMFRRPDLTSRFTDTDLRRIAGHVRQGYDADLRSRSSWESRTKAGMDLALQVVEEKSFPWPNASNVAFPLITIAALQFHARAYPALISGKEVVKVKEYPGATDQEKARSTAAAGYMNLQLLEATPWEEESDRGLLHLAIAGCFFKKTFFSPDDDIVQSELVFATSLVLNYYAKSVESCRRKSHRYSIHRNTLLEGMRMEKPKYRNLEKEAWFATPTPPEMNDAEGRSGDEPPDASDSTTPFDCIEQHCWLDLDDDGYEEPYIVTLDLGSNNILRIVARWERAEDVVKNARGQVLRIRATEHFTKYGFIPAPDGSIYDIGFGVLLGPLNESVSTLVNQLIDAGTMSTVGGGFLGKGAKIRGGTYSFRPGEWKRVDATGDDLKKSIVPLDPRDPSAVLFNLLNLLIQYTNRVAGTMESMVGENPGQNTPKSNMDSMIEQGMKIYSAIFKRVWRAMKEEFRKVYILNAFYAPERVQSFFRGDPLLCAPVADPEVSSEADRRTRAMLVAERAAAVPGYDAKEVEFNFLRAMKVENPERFYKGVDPNAKPPEDPRIVVENLRQAGRREDNALEWKQFLVELQAEQRAREADVLKILAQAKLAMAQADDARDNRSIVAMQTALAALKQRDDGLQARIAHMVKLAELESEPEKKRVNLEPIRRMANTPPDSGVVPNGASQEGISEGAMG